MPERMMDGYGTDELAIPTWKLCQNVGGDYAKGIGAVPGDFFCDLTEDIAKELNIIVVDIRKTRTYWGRTEIDDMPPECGSLDGKVSLEGEVCESCEHKTDAPWLISAVERRNMCTVSYNVLGINFDDSLPLLIRASGISALPVRQLMTQLRLNKTLKGEYHRAVIIVTSAPKKTPSGEAFSLHFKIKGLVQDQAQIEEFKQESASLLGTSLMLPEGREDEEPEPLGYLPDGTPFHSEAEKEQLIAQQLAEMDGPGKVTQLTEKANPQIIEPPASKETIETPPPAAEKAEKEAERKRKQEATGEQLPAREPLSLEF